MGKATQDLRNEHDAILQVLSIVDRMMAADTKEDIEIINFGNELIYFLKIFADKCHHGKEENLLFQELIDMGVEKESELIDALRQEHQQGREYLFLMNQSLESKDLENFKANLKKYRDLLSDHIAKENDVLLNTADRLLDDSKQDDLFEKFENHEETVVGHGIHEKLHSMIHKWEEDF